VQPVKDREVLSEQHHHNLVPVEHRTHDHRNTQDTESRLQQNAAQFKDQSVRGETRHTSAAAPSIAGEHVHHHIHETIQPVVQKETIEPHVVHTTVPIHEVHHNTAQHHAASALPAVGMSEFKKHGGSLTGREERHDHFAGEPRSIEHTLGSHKGPHHGTESEGLGSTGVGSGHSGHHGTNTSTGATSGLTGNHGTTGTGSNLTGQHGSTGTSGSGLGSERNTGAGLGNTSSAPAHKPSLMDKINPKIDSNGDGKAGFMK
jgi:hypothetical protein